MRTSILSVIIGTTVAITLSACEPASPEPVIEPAPTVTHGYHFVSDEFVVYVPDVNGAPVFLNILLSRKEVSPGKFLHYYSGEAVRQSSETLYTSQHRTDTAVVPDQFLHAYSATPATDRSPRSAYTVSLTSLDSAFGLTTETIAHDIVLRNHPDYTKLAGFGTGILTIDGAAYTAYVMHATITADDYRSLIFFDGRDKIVSETFVAVLWDKYGAAYFVDVSDVANPLPAYTSHAVAVRDDDRVTTTYAVTASQSSLDDPITMTFADTLTATILVRPVVRFGTTRENTLVTGTITNQGQDEVPIEGYVRHARYGSDI